MWSFPTNKKTFTPGASSRMRILYSHRINSHDGQGVHVEELVRAFREAGHEVTVIGPGFFEQSGFGGESRLVALARRLLPGALGEVAELAYTVPAYRRLRAAWREVKPDFVYERCNLYFLAGAWLARRDGARLFLEVNSPLAEERAQHGGLRLYRLARRLERATWRSAARVLPVTQVLADILVAEGVDPRRIMVMPNGVDPARFPPRDWSTAPPDVITLGFVGFVRAWHALDQVMAGMACGAGNTRLVIVGDGPVIPALRAQAQALGIGARVVFMGLVPPADIGRVVSGFDIALQPNATPYASPLKLFDYMAASCAIVAPDQPNIREILVHGQTALLFEPGLDGAMWRAVETLVADAALRARLGGAARAVLLERNHTWAGNASRIIALAQQDCAHAPA
jgi:glycosyltransferase involved in cell wall biosynthesis